MIEGIPISGLTPVGLILIAVLLLFTGHLVTRREANSLKEDRDYWRTAWETSEAARANGEKSRSEDREMTRKLLVYAEAADKLLRAGIPQRAEQGERG